MVDSRAKGARTETQIRDILRKYTGLQWERVPGSGALHEKHGLKGDLYCINSNNLFCVEVKGYAEDHLTSALLTSKTPQLIEFWKQAVRQGQQVKKAPLLIFKFDRSKPFVAFGTDTCLPDGLQYPYLYVSREEHEFFVALLEDWLQHEVVEFVA
jgi:Holliday junction resolvase